MKTAVGDFYEDDEPLDEVLIAFEAGDKFLTAPPPTTTSGTAITLTLD